MHSPRISLSLIIFGLICCSIELAAQQLLNRQWTSFHNGALTGSDKAKAITLDANGNIYVTGQSFQNSQTGSITTVMYDANGNMVWTDDYKGTVSYSVNTGEDICTDAFDNVIVTGTVAMNDGDVSVLKFDRNGRVWAKNKEPYWNGSNADFAREVATDAHGNIYCSASIVSISGNLLDVYTLKCDSAGNTIWGALYNSASGDDWAAGLSVTPDGHCFSITSSYNFFGSATYDMQTLHYDSSGAQQWISSYNFQSVQSQDYPMDIKSDAAFNTWVCGAADAGTQTDMAAIKQNSYGTRLWTVTYNGTANSSDTAIAIASLPNNLTVVTGRTKELVNGTARDVITTLLIDSGTVLWTQHYYGDSLNAIPTAMTTDSLGNIYISGYYQSLSGLNGVVLVYGPAGNLLFIDQFDGSAGLNDRFNDIVVDEFRNIYVTGQSYSQINNSDYVTIRYSASGLTGMMEKEKEADFLLYPNPASDKVHVQTERFADGIVEIRDISGKILLSQAIDKNEHVTIMHTGELKPGIYLVRLNRSEHCSARKLIIE